MIIKKLSDNKRLEDVIDRLHKDSWPAFLSEDLVVKKYWHKIYKMYPEYQLLFKDGKEYVGVGNSAPICWNGSVRALPVGFDEAVKNAINARRKPNTLCGMAAVVSKKYLGKGISSKIIAGFKKCAKVYGYSNLILPIRPTLKSQYPTISMEDYINWEKDGLPFDPWLRVHIKMGGKILKIANPSMVVEGTVADWQKWTGMYFGNSGDYVVRGALNPVSIDLKKDIGKYIEPNVWVSHKC